MTNLQKKYLSALSLLISLSMIGASAWATPSFTSLTDDDLTQISKEMSANFTHNSMMGASKLGTLFGFQVGFTAAQTSSPNTNTIAKRSAGSDLPNLYNAGLLGVIGVPLGISFEAVLIPKMTASSASFGSTSMAIKWNINEVIPVLPINLALRGLYSSSKFSFDQTISSLPATVENKTTVSGVQLLISPMLPIVEPYAGVGLLNGSNELSVTGTTGTVFDSTFSTAQSEKKNVSSTQFLLGAEVNLLLLKLGAEYSQSFGTSRYGMKLSLGF